MSKFPIQPLFDEHKIVADPYALQTWKDDPLCCKGRFTIGYGVEIVRASAKLPTVMSNTTKLPLFMMLGTADTVVTRQSHQLMVDLNQSGDATMKMYPSGRHNLLQEPSLKDTVIQDILFWIESRSICVGDACQFAR